MLAGMAEPPGPRYYAVYAVPYWDDFDDEFEKNMPWEDEEDQGEEGVDDWGHRGYFMVGPFGVYESQRDANRRAKEVSQDIMTVFSGSDGLDSSWALRRALPADCVACVRSYGMEAADLALHELDPAFHAKLRGVMTRMVEAKRAEYLDAISKHSKPLATKKSSRGRRGAAHAFFRDGLRRAGLPDDDPAARPHLLEAWVRNQAPGRSLARFLGHDTAFKLEKEYEPAIPELSCSFEIYRCGKEPDDSPTLVEIEVQSIPAPAPPTSKTGTIYAMVGRHEQDANGECAARYDNDLWRQWVHGLAWEPDVVSGMLVNSVRKYIEEYDLYDLRDAHRDLVEQTSRWPARDRAEHGNDYFPFYEEPVAASVLFAEGPFPRARVLRSALRIHEFGRLLQKPSNPDHGFDLFAGFRTRDGASIAMPPKPVRADHATTRHRAARRDCALPPHGPFFVHASRLDDAGMPIARGFVKSEDFSWGHWLDTYLMWPEAVPFHPATPESAA